MPGTLLETSHGKVASYQAARPAFIPQSGLKGLIDNETTASAATDTGPREAQRAIYIGTEKCIKIDHHTGVFPPWAPGNASFLAVIVSVPRSLYLLGLDGVELGFFGEFWRKISLRIDGVHGAASYQAPVS